MARYDRPKAVDDIVVESVLPLPRPVRSAVSGMVLMSVGMLIAPVMDAMAKYLGTTGGVSPGVVTLGRFSVQALSLFLLLSGLIVLGKKRRLWPVNITGNLLRGALMGSASFLFFTAVTFMPVADAIAIFFVEPFILTILSAFLLGEVVGWRRRIAVLVGFGGALLVIQPSFQELGFVTLLPMGTAFIFALYLILTRKLAADNDSPLGMQFVAGIGGVLTLSAALLVGDILSIDPLAPRWPDTSFLWVLIVGLGLLGTGSHLLIVLAFARARASVLAPFQYVEIVSATAVGYFIFNDFPDAIKWLGIAIIIGSGIYIFWREAKLSKQEESIS